MSMYLLTKNCITVDEKVITNGLWLMCSASGVKLSVVVVFLGGCQVDIDISRSNHVGVRTSCCAVIYRHVLMHSFVCILVVCHNGQSM